MPAAQPDTATGPGGCVPACLDRLLFAHPRAFGLTYAGHAWRSLALAAAFAGLAARAVVHAFVPALFPTSSTDAIEGGLAKLGLSLRPPPP